MRKISVPIISVDPFLGDKEIKWDKICEIESVAYPMQATSFNFNNQLQIYLSLEYRGGNSYLVLYYDKKRIKASKGDELLLLLDNSKSINLFFDSRSQAVVNDTIIPDRKSTRLNSSHANISYAVFCLKKKKNTT